MCEAAGEEIWDRRRSDGLIYRLTLLAGLVLPPLGIIFAFHPDTSGTAYTCALPRERAE
jgi:hypothetical protein